MTNEPTALQNALTIAAETLLRMSTEKIAATNELHICDDDRELLDLRRFTINAGRVCDGIFAAIAETAHVGRQHGDYATEVSDAIDGNLEFALREKAEDIFQARIDENPQRDANFGCRTHGGHI